MVDDIDNCFGDSTPNFVSSSVSLLAFYKEVRNSTKKY